LRRIDLEELDRAWSELAEEAASALRADGYTTEQIRISRLASLHYEGQSFDLTVKVDDGPISETSMTALEEAFGQEHERTYGHRAGEDEPVELTEIRLVAEVPSEHAPAAPLAKAPDRSPRSIRSAYFGPASGNEPASGGWLETPVLARSDLTTPQAGPCIIEEYDATCIIPPGARAELDQYGNIQITL
jgi:N-methylhydantoinase A